VGLLASCLALPLSCRTAVEPTLHATDAASPRILAIGDPRQFIPRARVRFRTPDDVLVSMQRAIESRSSADYLSGLSDPGSRIGRRPFRAIHDAAVRRLWEVGTALQAPDPWGIELERGLPRELSSIRPSFTYHFSWTMDPSA